ncbi:MAG: hypothetical protein FJZ56_00315 [Chlamydiae bacterium]|nr:hypothetical protein [Chlamydiota bacterium]
MYPNAEDFDSEFLTLDEVEQKPALWDHVTTFMQNNSFAMKALMITGIALTILGTLGLIAMAPMVGIPLAVVLTLVTLNFLMMIPQTYTLTNYDTVFPKDRIIQEMPKGNQSSPFDDRFSTSSFGSRNQDQDIMSTFVPPPSTEKVELKTVPTNGVPGWGDD